MSEQTTNSSEKGSIDIDRLLGMVTVVISIVALLLSIQANRIAAGQASENVVVLSSKMRGTGQLSDETGLNMFVCRHAITVFNFGGVSTSLIDWSAKIRFEEEEIHIDAATPLFDTPSLDGRMHGFSVNFTDGKALDRYRVKAGDGTIGLDTPVFREATFPLEREVEARSLSTIYTEIPYTLDGVYSWDEMEIPTRLSEYENPQSLYGLSPVEVSYEFTTASGNVVSSPYTPCFYLK